MAAICGAFQDAEADAWAPVDVVVATVGPQPLTRQQAALVSELWNGGVRATTLDHCQVFKKQ